jgi:protein TonB
MPNGRAGQFGRLTAALVGAALVNLFIFGLAPFLEQTHRGLTRNSQPPLSAYIPLTPPPPPPEEEEPPKPEPKQMDQLPPPPTPLSSDTPPPQLDTPPLNMEINSQLQSGPPLALFGRAIEAMQADSAPMAMNRVPPPYPYLARRRGLEGAVRVRFLVTDRGEVKDINILEAKPPGVFEQTVLSTLPRWRFKPGRLEGHPVPVWVETTVRFNLEDR